MILFYEIRVKNELDNDAWFEYFEELDILHLENGETLITGPVVDQSALHGLLARIISLNLALISVRMIDPG